MLDKAFLTGCDENTEWMLKWWWNEYSKHNDIPVLFANFGVSEKTLQWAYQTFDDVINITPHPDKNWFLKPKAMEVASWSAKKICWIDTDCQVLRRISTIFNYSQPNKLGMVQDLPWTKRRGSVWHNSGVVLFEGCPQILKDWKKAIDNSPTVGDQEVLHLMMGDDALKRRVYIEDLPNIYNWLRIQLLDGHDSSKKKIVHWTGHKGKQQIRKMIGNGEVSSNLNAIES